MTRFSVITYKSGTIQVSRVLNRELAGSVGYPGIVRGRKLKG